MVHIMKEIGGIIGFGRMIHATGDVYYNDYNVVF